MQQQDPQDSGASWASRTLPFVLVAWSFAVIFSTAAAEILLVSGIALAGWARKEPDRSSSWPEGWHSLIRGGPFTRWIPVLWLAFLGWYLVSIIFGVDPGAGLDSTPKLVRYGLFFLPLVAPFSAIHWRVAFWIQVILTLILIAPALDVLAGQSHRASTDRLHYNTLAQITAASSLMLLAAAMYGPVRARLERLAFLTGGIVAAGIMFATLSRAAWLAWWLGFMAIVLFRIPRRVAFAALILLVSLPLLAIPTLQQRRADLFDLNHPEFARRYDMWQMAIDILNDYPITGVGPSGLGHVYDEYRRGALVDDERRWITSHNDTLTVAVRHGWPAAGLWLAIGLSGLVAFLRRMSRARQSQRSWILAGFAGTAVCLQVFALFGLVHDNYDIWIKINMLLFIWGLFVATDRRLAIDDRSG